MSTSNTSRHLLLFGDYSVEKLPSIKTLVQQAKTVPAAQSFLQDITDIIQLEFSRADKAVHGWEREFGSLLELAEAVDDAGSSNLPAATVLLCAARLGQLIMYLPSPLYADANPKILGSAAEPVSIIGFCGGLLPAAVAWAAEDTSQLLNLAREIISISFRLACEVDQRRRLIDNALTSWGRTYIGLEKNQTQEILDKFHETQAIPRLRRITIGVIAEDWLTLIGPPSTMAMLRSCCWSPKVDTAKIIGSSPLLQQPLNPSKARLLSPAGCRTKYNHPTLASLLDEIIDDIAHKPLYITRTIRESVAGLQGDTSPLALWVMGATNHQAATIQILKAAKIDYKINPRNESNSRSDENGGPYPASARSGSGLVAIVGMAGRFPGSDTIPPSRFDISAFFDPTGTKSNSTTARHGAFLSSPGLFDHRLFNLSPREASQMDPGHRLLLTTAYEALQSAGYHPSGGLAAGGGGARVATYFGQAADEWREVLNQQGADIYYVPGFSRAFAPSRLNHHFGFGGASVALDSACATSASAVALAAQALLARDCDMALAGGVSVLLSPTTYAGLSRAGMLSTTGGCRTFHDDADGYAKGEAAAVVVLKRLEDAVADNDRVLAVVRGAVRAYGVGAQSMTRPCAAAQQVVYGQMLRQACLDPEEVVYVEMHGTGTQAGDVEEMSSVIGKRLSGMARGSAAGITSLIKTIMMIRERQIPPQPGWPFKLNHKFPDLAAANIRIPGKPTALSPSPKGDGKIKVVVNSFDASGGNVSIALQEAPKSSRKTTDSRAWHLVVVSARTPASLQRNTERLVDFLERHPETKLADLAYSTTARRMQEQLRRAYVGDKLSSIIRQLRLDVDKHADKAKAKPRKPSTVCLFTGQGSQYAGMGAVLFRTSRQFRDAVLSHQAAASAIGLPHFVDLISGEESGDMADQSTIKIQLAVVTVEIAMARLVQSWGITPDVVIGHSLGEYAALCIAGVLSASDTLFLVGERARLMERNLTANAYVMLAVSSTEEKLVQVIDELGLPSCTVACANAPSLTVASGTVADIEALKKAVESEGQRATLLRVPYCFHSRQIEPILHEYRQVAKGVHFAAPVVPVLSTLTGRVEREASAFSPEYLAQQAREKVNFRAAVEAGIEAGVLSEQSLWMEMGPDPVCLGLVRRCLDVPSSRLLPSLKQGQDNWATLSGLLKAAYESGIDIDWPELHKPFVDSLTLLDLPTYAFDSKEFWTPYMTVDPQHLSRDVQRSLPPSAARHAAGFPTTILQELESESSNGDAHVASFISRLSDSRVFDAISGHMVGGFEVCPLAAFQDIALTAARYLFGCAHGSSNTAPAMSLKDVDLVQALVLDRATRSDTVIYVTGRYLRTDAVVDIEFNSKCGGMLMRHGNCRVVFDAKVPQEASLRQQALYLVKSRIDSLRQQARSGAADRLQKRVIYQLFSGLVSYATPYQGLQEVIIAPDCADAVGTVRLQEISANGVFHIAPHWLDAVTHLAGFVVNCGLRYPEDIACLATGLGSWHSLKDLKAGGEYTIYTCLQDDPDGGHTVRGDCYVFSGGELVQATLNIKFLRLKKIALSTILGGGRAPAAGINLAPEAKVRPVADASDSVHVPEASADTQLKSVPGSILESMVAIIAEESGVDAAELGDESRYADVGVDSVMAINILARLSNEVGLELPAAFFLENDTIGDSKRSLLAHLGMPAAEEMDNTVLSSSSEPTRSEGPSSTNHSTPPEPAEHGATGASSMKTSLELDKLAAVLEKEEGRARDGVSAEVTHYQGPRTGDGKKIFFLADETGSTFAYIALPPLGSQLGVYGVDFPFINNEEASESDWNLHALATACYAAIRREQPSGPYIIGGTSGGALMAFEVARALLEAGEKVDGLLLLDCPSPTAEVARPGDEGDDVPREARAVFASHRPSQILKTQQPKRSLLVMPKHSGDTGSTEQQLGGVGWASLIPSLEVRETDIETGMFLDFSMMESLGDILRSAIEGIRDE
ncbi:hypothetical protein VTK56DRAFT_5242 [Thermocarpiscus australiensis]